ncbi:MAG: hypothetical protein ACK5YY_04645 [Alphaproteobacteria bacterium]|jgi:hypothetical protein|nr:hypothetical protein [Alphaproteobacteria bacterium]
MVKIYKLIDFFAKLKEFFQNVGFSDYAVAQRNAGAGLAHKRLFFHFTSEVCHVQGAHEK